MREQRIDRVQHHDLGEEKFGWWQFDVVVGGVDVVQELKRGEIVGKLPEQVGAKDEGSHSRSHIKIRFAKEPTPAKSPAHRSSENSRTAAP